MQRLKLTTAGKVVVFLVIAALVLGGTYFMGGLDIAKSLFGHKTQVASNNTTQSTDIPKKTDKNVIDISLDEWIGWKSIVDANGGLATKPGSIYDKLGIKVNIHVVDDANQTSNALISGNLDGAGYTINRYAFLNAKFKDNKVATVMPFITNFSSGGDGIIAKKGINRIEDLVGKTIGVPRFSEAQTLVEWLIAKSDLTADQKKQIKYVFFEDAEETGKAFYAGKVDAAATWQPYLSQASDPNSNAQILFSTKSASNIILDGIVFRKDFYDSHKEQVAKLIQGAIQAQALYTQQPEVIKGIMPQMADMTPKEIVEMTDDATLADYGTNMKLLSAGGLASTLFADMSNIWTNLGEKADSADASKVFDTGALQLIAGKVPTGAVQTPKFTEEQRQSVVSKPALLTKKVSIQFKVDSDEFFDKEGAYKAMNDLVNPAKIVDGMIIQIEGNTSSDGDPAINKELSYKRARAVGSYLKMQGLDATRFVVVGNGSDKPIGDNNTQNGREVNRRTEVFFKAVD